MLANGPVRAIEVMSQARGQGFSERTLRRAKKKLGVVTARLDLTGPWEWRMPKEEEIPDGQVE
jgi:hypothetical protein